MLLRSWARQGILPNINRLINHGLLAPSRSLDGFYVGSTWPSLYTGVSPAKHGLHYLKQLVTGTYEFQRKSDTGWIERPPFWTALARAGRRVAILDVPLSRLDQEINGVQVVEWGSHDAVFGFSACPAEFEASIRERYGAHPAGNRCDAPNRSAGEYEEFITALERGAGLKGKLTADLIRQGGWDLVMQVFTESHCAGHQCWHLHDPDHPNHDPVTSRSIGDPLQRVYTAIDHAIGEIVEQAGDVLVFVVVAHGMSHRFGASFLLEEILVNLGVTLPPPESGERSRAYRLAASLWRALPSPIKRGLKPIREMISSPTAPESSVLAAHLRASPCFPVGNGLAAGGIRLNLKGREPAGVLEPGREANEFCRKLTEDLLAIIDQRTGRRLIQRVLRTSELYQGDRLSDLPDLLVEWSDEAPTGSANAGNGAGAVVRASSERLGSVEDVNTYGRTGEHRAEGLIIASGRGIPPGELGRVVSILDFAPTIASLFGIQIPESDGSAIPEMVVPLGSGSRPPQ